MDAASNNLVYATFWKRFWAKLLDFAVMLPFAGLAWWGGEHFKLFSLYALLPDLLFGLFYYVFLVKRFEGTPGKRILGLRIRRIDGQPVGYREALMRYWPDAVMWLLGSVGPAIAVFNLTDAEYFGASFLERAQLLQTHAPHWTVWVTWAMNAWLWSELLVILTNKKRRSIQDFIAHTVVIRTAAAAPDLLEMP